MNFKYIISLSVFFPLLLCAQGKIESDFSLTPVTNIEDSKLRQSFLNPPGEARMSCYWWWLNSMATKESITRDLEEMRAKGYGSATLIDAGSSSYEVAKKTQRGPLFMSKEWMDLFKHAVKEADRMGISLCVNVQSGWNPGAPSITPEFALKKLTYADTSIVGGRKIYIELPQPDSLLIYKDICVQAIRKSPSDVPIKDEAISFWSAKSFNADLGFQEIFPLEKLRDGIFEKENSSVPPIKKSEVIDLTDHFDGKKLHWKAPEGEWTIIRYGGPVQEQELLPQAMDGKVYL